MLDWYFAKKKVYLSIPGYVENPLQYFKQKRPSRPQHQPYQHTIPAYGAKIKYVKPEDSSQPLTKEETAFVQQVIGTFLFYGIVVDATMLTALSAI